MHREEVVVTCARAVSFVVIHFAVMLPTSVEQNDEWKKAEGKKTQAPAFVKAFFFFFQKWMETESRKNGIQSFPTSAWILAAAAAVPPAATPSENQCARQPFCHDETMKTARMKNEYNQFCVVMPARTHTLFAYSNCCRTCQRLGKKIGHADIDMTCNLERTHTKKSTRFETIPRRKKFLGRR